MNIKATNSTAVSKVTADIKIKYRMSTRGTEAVKDVTAEISNDETVVGFFNISKNGVTGFFSTRGSRADSRGSETGIPDCY